jgi:hypothetical protein
MLINSYVVCGSGKCVKYRVQEGSLFVITPDNDGKTVARVRLVDMTNGVSVHVYAEESAPEDAILRAARMLMTDALADAAPMNTAKTIADRIQEVRAYVAEHLCNVPGSPHYVMELDAIAHDVALIETCPHGWLPANCRKCRAKLKGETAVKIIVNGQEMPFSGSQISYDEVIALAGKTGHPSVTYRGHVVRDSRREGLMHPGCAAVEVDDGMVFNVMHTGNG